MSKTFVVEPTQCTARNRGLNRIGLWGPVVLIVGLCLTAAGCGSLGNLGSGSLGATPWLSSEAKTKTTGERFKREVEADAFPTAAQAGL